MGKKKKAISLEPLEIFQITIEINLLQKSGPLLFEITV